MKFRPLHDRVVIRRLEGEEKTKGGIIIPDTVKEKPQEGEVIAIGPGARDESGKLVPLDVKKGDKVLFGKWSGTEVKIDGQDLLIMKESDMLLRARSPPRKPPKTRTRSTKRLESKLWPQKTLDSPQMPATACCVGSIFSTTPSR
jgi:chaperonin GroES